MSKWYRYAPIWRLIANKFLRHATALAAVSLGAATLMPAGVQVARGDDATGDSQAREGSLLVATRDDFAGDSTEQTEYTEVPEDDASARAAQSADNAPDVAVASDENSLKLDFEAPRAARQLKPSAAPQKTLRRTPAVAGKAALEPVRFQGITVGQSTKSNVQDEWGDPADSVATAEGSVLAYDIDPFQAVEVLVGEGEVVTAIKIALAAPLDPQELAEQLSLSDIRPVTAKDETDQPLGLAFPERGVIFMYDAADADLAADDDEASANVSHVVLQRLDPLAFAMRAASAPDGEYAQNINDLKTAIRLDAKCAHAYALLAKIYRATGQADLAEEAARTASEIDPENATYQLHYGRTLELRGQYDEAVLTVRGVLDRENLAPIDKAQALHQMGYLASLGDMEIASKAIGFHIRAIETADPLATSSIGKERRAAKQLLVEAHLAIAEEVARQSFNDKIDNLSQWIGRASGIAEEFIGHDGGSIELRLLVAQSALASLASFRPTLDPGPWVKESEEAAEAMFALSNDDLWQARVKWELGVAYLNALRVEHLRRETKNALVYGNKAVDYLARGAKLRQAVHSSEQLIGQLYFQMGAVQAVHELDHQKAVKWYDKAEPLLSGPLPKSELFAPRREGEMLVSMGVTYWQLGEKNRAVALTQNGVNLVEAAVEAGILARSTLGVPYGNLATMYQKLGESSNAAKYSELAKSVTDGGAPERVGQTPAIRQTSNTSGKSAQQQRATSQR